MVEGGSEAAVPYTELRPPTADIFLTNTASKNVLPVTPATFKPPNDIKKVKNKKLQKNTKATTVLTAFFYP